MAFKDRASALSNYDFRWCAGHMVSDSGYCSVTIGSLLNDNKASSFQLPMVYSFSVQHRSASLRLAVGAGSLPGGATP